MVGKYFGVKGNYTLMFPLVLLQAKVVGKSGETVLENMVSVSISSPSSEGGGSKFCSKKLATLLFPLVLLQAKVVGSYTTFP